MNLRIMKLLIFQSFILLTQVVDAQKIFCISIPKCGTHLLSKCVSLLTKKKEKVVPNNTIVNINNQEFYLSHSQFNPQFAKMLKEKKFKTFFIYRDPRDQIVSYTFFILKIGEKVTVDNKQYISFEKRLFPADFDSLLKYNLKNVNKIYKDYIPWIKCPFVYSIKFEDLVGIQGGGESYKQIAVIKNICKYLKIHDKNMILARNCVQNLFGGTWTFRKGKIGSWKQYLNQENKKLFKNHAGQILITLGYETNQLW